MSSWEGPLLLGGVLNTGFAPIAMSWGPGRIDIFGVAHDLQLLHWWYEETYRHRHLYVSSGGPEPLGGQLASNPTAVSWAPGRLDVFWIDAATGQIAQLTWGGSGWSTPQLLGGYNLLPQFYPAWTAANANLTPNVPSIAAVSLAPGLLDVFATYTNSGVVHWWYNNGTWQGSEFLPDIGLSGVQGEPLSAPKAISGEPNRMDVFVNVAQGYLVHWWKAGQGGWKGPEALPAGLASNYDWQGPPIPVSWGVGHLDVFGEGVPEGISASQLMHFSYASGSWTGPVPLGGFMTSAPSAVSWGPGRLDVFSAMANPGGFLQHWWWDNGPQGAAGGWGGPETIYGFFTNQPSAVSFASGRLDIYGIDADSLQLTHWWWDQR
jgi:hypothetical protein